MKWVKKKTGPPAASVATVAELDELKAGAGTVVLAYLSESKVLRLPCSPHAASLSRGQLRTSRRRAVVAALHSEVGLRVLCPRRR